MRGKKWVPKSFVNASIDYLMLIVLILTICGYYILVEKSESVNLTVITVFAYNTNLPTAIKNLMHYVFDV